MALAPPIADSLRKNEARRGYGLKHSSSRVVAFACGAFAPRFKNLRKSFAQPQRMAAPNAATSKLMSALGVHGREIGLQVHHVGHSKYRNMAPGMVVTKPRVIPPKRCPSANEEASALGLLGRVPAGFQIPPKEPKPTIHCPAWGHSQWGCVQGWVNSAQNRVTPHTRTT